MLKSLLLPLLGFAIIVIGGSNPAFAEKRIALVVGNSAYEHTAPLRNPKNDASDMAEKLRGLDFEVIDAVDLSKREMEQQIRKFARKLPASDVALFFYAGHGMRVDGRNFLVPVDAQLKSESDLDFEAIELDLVLKQMERNARISLVFLDACRDNPLASRLEQASRSTSVGRGLARIEKPVGMLIAFATEPENIALDGEGRNSPFTAALLRHIDAEGKSIADVMIAVRNEVRRNTGNKQTPWDSSSLTDQFYFKPPQAVAEGVPQTASEIASLREEIIKLQSLQTERLAAQEEQLKLLQQKLALAEGKAEPETEPKQETAISRVITVEPSAVKPAETGDTKPAAAVTAAQTPASDSSSEPAAQGEVKAGSETAAQTGQEATDKAAEEAKPASESETAKVAAVDAASAEAVAVTETQAGAPPEIDVAVLSRDIQSALKELQCYGGKVDGIWGPGTRRALAHFNQTAKLELTTDTPEPATLEQLQAWKGGPCVIPEEVVREKAPRKPAVVRKERRRAPPPDTEIGIVGGGGGIGIRIGPGRDIETDTVRGVLRPNLD